MPEERIALRAGDTAELRCPYCHDALLAGDARRACAGCGAAHHEDCWGLHGGCSTCGREQPSGRRGRAAAIDLTGGSDRLTISFGDRPASARRALTLGALCLVLGLMSFAAMGVHSGPGFLPLFAMGGVVWGMVILISQLVGLDRSGRLRVDEDGVHIQPLTWRGRYGPGLLVPWSDLETIDVSRREVYADPGGVLLARTRSDERARRIKRQLERARAHFHSALEPGAIRIRGANPEP